MDASAQCALMGPLIPRRTRCLHIGAGLSRPAVSICVGICLSLAAALAVRAAPDPAALVAGTSPLDDRVRWVVVQQPAPTRSTFDWIEKGIQAVATLVGGVWVWSNYLLNRTHRARLEARMVVEHAKPDHVRIVLTLKNVGLSKVDIDSEGSGARLYSLERTASRADPWKHRATESVWGSVKWIEPNESCEEQHLWFAPLAFRRPLRVELFIACSYRPLLGYRRRTQWARASFVLNPPSDVTEIPT